MTDFLLGVGASAVGGLLLFVGARISARWRGILWRIASRLAAIDIDRVYLNKLESQSDLEADVRRAQDIALVAGRGNELQREAFASVFLDRPANRQVRVRILLPDTSVPENVCDWAARREEELAEFDSAFGPGLLHLQIDANVAFLQPHVDSGRIELRRYNMPHMGRILLVDGVAYFTPYRSGAHGRDSKVYKFQRNGQMAENLKRFLELIWSACGVAHGEANNSATDSF